MSLRLFEYDNPAVGIFDDSGLILKELSDDEWASLLSHMEQRKFPAGAVLLDARAKDRALYFVATGSVAATVTTDGVEQEIALIGEGSVFGEMAFLDGLSRSATIRAREPVEVLSLSYESFKSLMAWEPQLACKLVLDVGRVLSLRLRHSRGSV